jgi:YD repeat-containing protein
MSEMAAPMCVSYRSVSGSSWGCPLWPWEGRGAEILLKLSHSGATMAFVAWWQWRAYDLTRSIGPIPMFLSEISQFRFFFCRLDILLKALGQIHWALTVNVIFTTISDEWHSHSNVCEFQECFWLLLGLAPLTLWGAGGRDTLGTPTQWSYHAIHRLMAVTTTWPDKVHWTYSNVFSKIS